MAASSQPPPAQPGPDNAATERVKAVPSPAGAFSFASAEAVARLAKTDVNVGSLESHVTTVEKQWRHGQIQTSEARSQLAAIEAQMKRIETAEIDDVQTGDLHSGKDHARSMKKAQLKSLEVLFERVEGVFNELRQSEPKS